MVQGNLDVWQFCMKLFISYTSSLLFQMNSCHHNYTHYLFLIWILNRIHFLHLGDCWMEIFGSYHLLRFCHILWRQHTDLSLYHGGAKSCRTHNHRRCHFSNLLLLDKRPMVSLDHHQTKLNSSFRIIQLSLLVLHILSCFHHSSASLLSTRLLS